MRQRLNLNGDGFEYGRSLGPYGLTALIEVLTAAAVLDVLNEQEKAVAYAFISRAGQHYVDFWLNPRTGSVDLWDQGRRTDAYRGKFRILGENLSLAHQFVYTNALWNRLGFQDVYPTANFASASHRLPKRTVTWFARAEYDRMLLTLRDGNHVIGLPLINGATSQHMHNPYFPIPYSPGLFDSVADGSSPQLIPQLTLSDGSVLSPLAYFQHVNVTERGAKTVVTFELPHLDALGAENPVADVIIFGRGMVRKFSAFGFERCSVAPVQDDVAYHTPTGPFATRVLCESASGALQRPLKLGCTLNYSDF